MNLQREGRFLYVVLFCLSLLTIRFGDTARALDFPGPDPGEARAQVDDAGFVLENEVVACNWTVADGRLKPVCVVDKLSGRSSAVPSVSVSPSHDRLSPIGRLSGHRISNWLVRPRRWT
jgi:hypothetical protein